jgi:hypothetical protein
MPWYSKVFESSKNFFKKEGHPLEIVNNYSVNC